MKYKNLFTPLNVNGCVFPNRIMSTSAVTRLAGEDGHVTEEITNRYKRLAKGGLGSMVVEAAVVLPSRSSFNLRLSDDQFVPQLSQFVDAIRGVNSDVRIGIQLIHFLKLSRSGWRQRVEDLSRDDIAGIPELFASAAVRARKAGFDFVELHMAHFTTLASFLSLVNKREDEYGGDFEGRIRLPAEVLLATRNALGRDYPIGMRMNGEEFTKEGNTLLQSTRVAVRMAELGADYISVSAGERFEDGDPPAENFPPFAGTGYSGYRMSPRWWNPDGPQVFLADGIRQAVRAAGRQTAVITAGKIRTPDFAEEILEGGRADVIGMSRALLCDPDWPGKALMDKADDIVLCAACGYCSEADERYDPVTCIQWPAGSRSAPSPWLLKPPCTAACPAGVDVRRYVELVTRGRLKEALSVLHERLPLPAVVSRVCPRFCEAQCNRGCLDTPVAINALKRYVCDFAGSKPTDDAAKPAVRKRTERVAIVGAGPAGLSAASFLARLGYRAVVFEASGIIGGMLAMGIPHYRLPRDILEKEIESVRRQGVEIRLNTPVGPGGITLDELERQGYEAIFIATGAHKSARLEVPNAGIKDVMEGVGWLKDVNLGKQVHIGKRVIVIGGGNVAIDAARTAARLGAEKVTIVYRRSREEMPALQDEVIEAEKEGIEIRYLSSPCRIVCEGDECRGLECFATELGEADESGRRRPIRVEGSEFVLDGDMVLTAIGERPDVSWLQGDGFELTGGQTLKVDALSQSTNVTGVFAGGDVTTGPASVVEAIAAGRRAAGAIDRYIRGQAQESALAPPEIIQYEQVEIERFRKRPRMVMPTLPVPERVADFEEVDLGLSNLEALKEADRCLQCGMFPRK